MKQSDKDQVRALLDKLPDDATFADIQRAIAVLVWPKRDDGSLAPPGPLQQRPKRLEPEEVKRRLRDWLKSERDK
ncbi:MAG: hypothetical protein J0J01_03330 [Reyranella sp.]|uniref:hypothetical protein n=1 Tax=Reyranella sp. TaxID=1929291 RepID=UPI001AC9F749|nr:hypothetical protein [Reyranella sp.]MBN9085919.1 hypothetical protein [Reyranella sp.]